MFGRDDVHGAYQCCPSPNSRRVQSRGRNSICQMNTGELQIRTFPGEIDGAKQQLIGMHRA